MKEIPLSEAKDDFSHLLREAAKQDIVITRHGKPAGVLIGFASEDDWLEYRLENDPRFLRRIDNARRSLRGARRSPGRREGVTGAWGNDEPAQPIPSEGQALG